MDLSVRFISSHFQFFLVGERSGRRKPPAERGALYNRQMYQMRFFCTFACPARPTAAYFSRSRLRDTRGGACTPRRKCGFRPGSVTRALGVQNCAIRHAFTGSFSASSSLAGQWKPDNLLCSAAAASCLYHTVPQALKLSTWWQPRYNSSRTSSSSFCDRHGRCICCVRVCACPPRQQERTHNLKSGDINWMLRRGQDGMNPHFLGISKAAAQPRYTPQQQQRYNSSTTAPVLQILAFATATVLLCSYVCAQQCSPEFTVDTCNHDHKITHKAKNKHTSSDLMPVIEYTAVLFGVNRDA